MKTYQIELRRVLFINLTIEADSVEHAEALALEHIDQEYYFADGEWNIETIELEEQQGAAI